jgi:hypothetical protein
VNALSLYHDLKKRGVTLEAEGEHLLVDAPTGVVTEEDKAILYEAKPVLLRLLSRPALRKQEEYDGPRLKEHTMHAHDALLKLLKKEQEWSQFFCKSCEKSPLRLRSQAWQFRDELSDQGESFSLADLEDVLMGLARRLFSESPAAQWDPDWAQELTKDSMARLQEHYTGLSAAHKETIDLAGQDPWHESMQAAALANDPAAFRAALLGWEREALEVLARGRGDTDKVSGKRTGAA